MVEERMNEKYERKDIKKEDLEEDTTLRKKLVERNILLWLNSKVRKVKNQEGGRCMKPEEKILWQESKKSDRKLLWWFANSVKERS